MMNGFKIGAAICCFLYVISFLVLPFIVIITVMTIPGSQLLSTAWGWIVLLTGIAMGVCALLVDGKIAGIVSGVGAIVPLIVFFVAPGSLLGSIIPADLGGISGIASSFLGRYVFQIGVGVILPMLFGIGSAVLCFLSEYKKKPKQITAGLGADTDDDW